MPYLATSQEWLEQSTLLIEARPTTVGCHQQHLAMAKILTLEQTRITTKYSVQPVKARKRKTDGDGDVSTEDKDVESNPPRGSLVLKTYDTASGVTLKYRTTKAAEVSRLVYASLGRLGRSMAAMPLEIPEEPMPDAATGEGAETDGKAATPQQATQPQQSGGGGKKKKKGKK